MMGKARILQALMAIVLIVVLFAAPVPARAASVSVNTTSDVNDGNTTSIANLIANPGADGKISLREAIVAANNSPGDDTINFSIPYGDAGYDSIMGYWTIQPTSVLPPLTGGGTDINGYSQMGALQATDSALAVIKIRLDGTLISLQNGLNIASASNRVRGLSIVNFPGNGIFIYNFGEKTAEYNIISGNYIGLEPDYMTANGNDLNGIYIAFGARFNTIGGGSAAERNVISSNGVSSSQDWEGIAIHGAETQGNVVMGNYIGTDAVGANRRANRLDGVRIYGGAHSNVIGPDNLISGNNRDGVRIAGNGTDNNQVLGNWIGLNAAGDDDIYNIHGVYITDGAQENTIGGTAPTQLNVISGNDNAGVALSGTNTSSNVVSGNYIGTAPDGGSAIPNDYGVLIMQAASNNTIGGDSAAERNVISGNLDDGVLLENSGTTGNTVMGNIIGLGADGDTALGNGGSGIKLENTASLNIIGPGNVVSANASAGISLDDYNTSNNQVNGNLIGTDAAGTADRGNTNQGIRLGAANNTIGSSNQADRNVISGNGSSGIALISSDCYGNMVRNNYIGVAVDGVSPLANDGNGISITSSAHDNIIGGGGEDQGNLVSANLGNGIYLHGLNTNDNTVSGNFIGTGPGGLGDIGNEEYGVYVVSGASDNQIGPRNVIAYNGSLGVYIRSSDTVGVVVTESSIHDQATAISLDMANNDIPTPTITGTGPSSGAVGIAGTACPGCVVEIFCNPTNKRWATEYVGTTTADGSGNFSLTVYNFLYPYLTATATDATDGTSRVSETYQATYQGIFPIFLPQLTR